MPAICARPRAEAVVPDALTEAATLTTSDRVEFLDFSDYFCDATTCYAAVGDAMTYYDDDHMTGLYSWSLGPYVEERLDQLWD